VAPSIDWSSLMRRIEQIKHIRLLWVKGGRRGERGEDSLLCCINLYICVDQKKHFSALPSAPSLPANCTCTCLCFCFCLCLCTCTCSCTCSCNYAYSSAINPIAVATVEGSSVRIVGRGSFARDLCPFHKLRAFVLWFGLGVE